MSRYFFDIHAGSLSDWDGEGREAPDVTAAIAHAQYVLEVVIGEITRRGGSQRAIISIRDIGGLSIATVLVPNADAQRRAEPKATQ